ncbi:hypothetical protein AK830_g1334 [Neonectria ditissima]|uniref:Fe2OG dioxygenase domain-containing protein n=1 Tax=Neonectria ditissima TaxID=78410 RepID=A0A0P7BET5_9HYPO|nr:hypothetical protein AK830_g1334 [Neonectria ditissima]
MESASDDGRHVPDTEMPDAAPAGPNVPHPIGWSLQDEEYESDPEDSTEDHSLENTDDQDGTDSDDVQGHADNALGRLRDCLESSCKDTLFACGGAVPIVSETESPVSSRSQDSNQDSSTTASSTVPHPTITLRWDPRDSSTPAAHCRLTAPLDDTVSQLLLPNPKSGKQRAVKADLYKLNVYTGPSGHFRAHVDTPRSQSQFGSLVVCLPFKHDGGALEVRHGDQVLTFDWASCASSDSPQIQWAAFYSDCEHEVFPVQSGHRITLTYNLYATSGNSQLSNRPNALDTAQMPLYRHLEAAINDDTFLPDGGFLGFYTTHAYPQTASQPSQDCLSGILKGLDMAIWHAFQRLGCGVCLRPVLVSDPFLIRSPGYKVGKEFAFKNFDWQVEEYTDWKLLLENWGTEKISWEDLIWLNEAKLKTKHASFSFIAYGNEASSRIAYSVCAIIIGVPKWHEGERMRLETTFTDKKGEEEDWEDGGPYRYD